MNQHRMRRLIGLAVIAVVCLASPHIASAQGELPNRADAVVVAELESGRQTGHALSFTLSIVRTLKGNLAPGTTISVSGSAGDSRDGSLGGHYGLWFLKEAGGQWALIPAFSSNVSLDYSGYLPLSKTASPAGIATKSPPATLADRMAAELATAMLNHPTPSQIYKLAWGMLRCGQSAFIQQLYGTLAASADPDLRFFGETGFWGGAGEVQGLADMAGNVQVIPQLHTGSFVVTSICGARSTDPGAIRSLGTIAASTDERLERCAAMALDFIHTRDTLPFLAQLLGSSDAKTREYAIQGLSRFVDNLPIQNANNIPNGGSLVAQGTTPYRTAETDQYSLSRGWLDGRDDAPYLQFWKTWWAATKDKIAASAP